MALKELSDGGPDGTRLGQSTTDKVAFFGTTPVVRPTVTAVATATATTTLNERKIDRLYAAIRALGLIN
jgi:hypothetical protein